MALVLDTGVVLAAIDRDDPDHSACAALLREMSGPLLMPAPVLPELDYLLRRRVGGSAVADLIEEIVAGALRIVDLTRLDYARCREIVDTYADTPVGFVDAAVLAVTERLGETKLATLDRRHFAIIRPRHVAALELLPA